ncbi:abortive phage infection protein [Clostridiaceae bacterium]|nr:abortive phage infection protein [Clostridiaceae bacterium]RKI11392.1 abortive phage infection protein [bacterium 1XD21-70]
MGTEITIKTLLENSPDGIITARQITESGMHRSILQKLVKDGELYRYGRGIYSHDTALYLLGYSDRTPAKYTMTFPKGYNAPSLKQENIIVKRVVPDNYTLEIIEIKSPCGNPIKTYNLERTLCDIVRGSGSDIQIVNGAMKRYAASKEKDIHKLMKYAGQLRVKPKILHYMEVLL